MLCIRGCRGAIGVLLGYFDYVCQLSNTRLCDFAAARDVIMDFKVLKELRRGRGMGLSELSKLSGVSIDRLGLIERGEVLYPNYATIERIVEALGYRLSISLR